MKNYSYEEVVWWTNTLWSDQVIEMLVVLGLAGAAIMLYSMLGDK